MIATLDTAAAGRRFGDGDDEIGKLDEFHEDLRHQVVKGQNFSLRQMPEIDADAAHVNERDDGGVEDDVGERVHQRADAADELLTFR